MDATRYTEGKNVQEPPPHHLSSVTWAHGRVVSDKFNSRLVREGVAPKVACAFQ